MNYVSVHGKGRASLATMPEQNLERVKEGRVVRNQLAQAKINPGIPGKLPGARVPGNQTGLRAWKGAPVVFDPVLRMGARES